MSFLLPVRSDFARMRLPLDTCYLEVFAVGQAGWVRGNLFETDSSLGPELICFLLFPLLTGPVCFPQSVCFGYCQIAEGLEGRSHLPEHDRSDNLRKPCASGHAGTDQRLHRLIPRAALSGVG